MVAGENLRDDTRSTMKCSTSFWLRSRELFYIPVRQTTLWYYYLNVFVFCNYLRTGNARGVGHVYTWCKTKRTKTTFLNRSTIKFKFSTCVLTLANAPSVKSCRNKIMTTMLFLVILNLYVKWILITWNLIIKYYCYELQYQFWNYN